MKKKDFILAGALLLAAFLLFAVLRLQNGKAGAKIRITVDGELYGTYSLLEERIIRVEQESGVNMIHIRDGAAWMEEADCPDGYCIRQGKIGNKNQTIVCLPHKLVVEVFGGDANGQEEIEPPDAVVH